MTSHTCKFCKKEATEKMIVAEASTFFWVCSSDECAELADAYADKLRGQEDFGPGVW